MRPPCSLPLLLSAHSWKIAHSTPLLSSLLWSLSRLSAHCIGPLFHQNHFGRDESPQSASGEACFVPQFGHPPSLPLRSVLFGLGMDQHGRKFALFIPRAHSTVPCLPRSIIGWTSFCHPQRSSNFSLLNEMRCPFPLPSLLASPGYWTSLIIALSDHVSTLPPLKRD